MTLVETMYNFDPYIKITQALKREFIHPDDKTHDFYYYIPSSNVYIKTVLLDLLKDPKLDNYRNFIDIGAGTPLIMDIFKQVLPDLSWYKRFTSLELSDIYCELFKKLTKGDLLTYNFKEYDILYSYNPIRNCDLMIEGLKNIINTMKEGAILYFVAADYKVEKYLQDNLATTDYILLDKNSTIYKYTKPVIN